MAQLSIIAATLDGSETQKSSPNFIQVRDGCSAACALALRHLCNIPKKKRRKLGANPLDRAFQERLQKEYQASLDKLLPIKEQLAATDRLIDLIVYRLYGLTPEEVTLATNG